jgi:hypothetical protein
VKEKGASALFFVDIGFCLFYKVHVTNREKQTMTNEEKIQQISLKIDTLYDYILDNSSNLTKEEVSELEDEIEKLEVSLNPYYGWPDPDQK